MKAKSCQISLLFLLLLVFSSFAHADTNIINVYDANGNLVTGDGNYYEYNDANQLVKVRQGDQNGAVIAEYFYDYSGQRVKKIENGVTTYYVGPHFEKQVGGAEAGDSKYYFADGERVAKKDPAGNVYYYHSDHLGGVNAVTDSAGTVVARADYMPFGDVKQGSTGNEKYSYTGKEKDKTDLYYFEARYNSPMFRHFTQADTVAPDLSDPQDLNRYSYVGNNPLSYVDYDGHKKKKKSKKKAKLSKREKYLIAHGIDPDKDKTSLKEAKKKYEEKSHQENNNVSTISVEKTSGKICTDVYCDIDAPTEEAVRPRPEHLGNPHENTNFIDTKYGNYCGPGWTAGQDDGNDYRVKAVDSMDILCRDHDVQYGVDDRLVKHYADLKLLSGLQRLDPNPLFINSVYYFRHLFDTSFNRMDIRQIYHTVDQAVKRGLKNCSQNPPSSPFYKGGDKNKRFRIPKHRAQASRNDGEIYEYASS